MKKSPVLLECLRRKQEPRAVFLPCVNRQDRPKTKKLTNHVAIQKFVKKMEIIIYLMSQSSGHGNVSLLREQ